MEDGVLPGAVIVPASELPTFHYFKLGGIKMEDSGGIKKEDSGPPQGRTLGYP